MPDLQWVRQLTATRSAGHTVFWLWPVDPTILVLEADLPRACATCASADEGHRRVLNFATSVTGGILFESAEAARDLFCRGRRPVLTIANLVRLRYFTEDLG